MFGIRLSEALVVTGLGIVGVIGSIRLWLRMSENDIEVIAGPEKFLGVVSLTLVLCGVISIMIILYRSRYGRINASIASLNNPIRRSALTLVAVLFGYTAAVQIIGYFIGNFCFFPLLFHVSGLRPLSKSILVGTIMAGIFYVLFVLLFKLPVPRGMIGL